MEENPPAQELCIGYFAEEPGKLEVVAGLALDWLVRHLPGREQAERAA